MMLPYSTPRDRADCYCTCMHACMRAQFSAATFCHSAKDFIPMKLNDNLLIANVGIRRFAVIEFSQFPWTNKDRNRRYKKYFNLNDLSNEGTELLWVSVIEFD